jgi:hypothetical protein
LFYFVFKESRFPELLETIPMTEGQIRDAAHDWAVRLKDLEGKIAASHYNINGVWGDTQYFLCRECETLDAFRSAHAAVTVAHIMEEHPPPPLVKSADKC